MTTKEKLVFLGCNEWEKYGKHRVYISPEIICKVIDFKYSTNRTGDINNDCLNGRDLSKNKARMLKNVIENANMFYDVTKEKYFYSKSGTDFDEELSEFIELIEEANIRDLESWKQLPNPMFD